MDHLPKVIGGAAVATASLLFNGYIAENWVTLASFPVGVYVGEVTTRIFLYAKTFSPKSPLIDKYSLLDFFTSNEKNLSLVALPLTSLYALRHWESQGLAVAVGALSTFLARTLLLKSSPLVVKQMFGRDLNGIYYGPAIAYSYFYGYFKIILFPQAEGQSFKNKIDDYIEANKSDTGKKISVPDKRLQILIPLSGEFIRHSSLADNSDDWIVRAKTPAMVEVDRGAIGGRKYHNTMYRIKKPESEDEPVYVVAEYATPIITYVEACKFSGETDLMDYKREAILSFTETLQRLIDMESETKDNVNLILYEGVDEKGNPVNLAHVLLKNILPNN
ncbi:stimulator of interferon genes protein-like [Neocloeon triangulifer]|uniref:stimulator of interferon genes protein-like n=1 Tax=Neocloeon triangulifer TaxID=2078957 RepID=UPI00286F04D3|nr:stimulator of interferon genes protein-like [Neocloeon triangulifer]XP_059477184.1 stimulator of interferon genes protein-like [Neocloeon triangulifer]XP_059477185.1 stimulator of interferon genes protein-like [Neocloeon triangulifer]XP_059477186.1 stimulator of interferon genes protein-like [Neocloeon triangulifer]